MPHIGDMFNLEEYRQIFEMNYIRLYYRVLVASYDHRHKPEVAHHVGLYRQAPRCAPYPKWFASFPGGHNWQGGGGVSTLRFEKLCNQESASGLRI